MADKTVTVRLEAVIGQYQASLLQASGATRTFGKSVSDQTAKAQLMQQGFQQLGLGALALGTAMLGGFALATKAAIDFESSFAGVRKTVDATEAEFGVLSDGLRDMATEIPVNVNELNRIAEAAGQLGIENDAILGFTRTVADMGVATNLSSEQAADAFARLGNIMQTPQTQFSNMGSAIVHLGNVLPPTEQEIVEFGLRIAGAGHLAGLAESDVLGIGAAMASVGIEAEAGGTAVQKVLLELTDAVNKGGSQLDTFATTAGMSATEFAEMWRAEPAQAFTAFVEGLGASGQQARGVLEELGLTDQRLIRSFLSLAGAGDLLRTSIDQGSTSWEKNAALAAEAEERYGTTSSAIKIALNRINEAAISFGEVLLPVIAAVVGPISDFVALLGKLPAPLRGAAMAAISLGGAVLLLGGGLSLLLPRLALAANAIGALTGAAAFNTAASSIAGVAGAAKLLALRLTLVGTAAAMAYSGVNSFLAGADDIGREFGVLEETVDSIKTQMGSFGASGWMDITATTGTKIKEATEAWAAFRDEMVLAGVAEDDLSAAFKNNIDLLNGNRASIGPWIDAMRSDLAPALLEINQGQYEASESATVHEDALTGLSDEMSETSAVGDVLLETLTLLSGAQLDAEKATLDWHDGLRTTRKELRHGTKTLSGYGVEASKNKQVILDQIDLAMKRGAAIATETGSVRKGAAATAGMIKQIMGVAVASGFSREKVRDYIAQLELTPKNIRTAIKAELTAALGDVRAYKEQLASIPRNITTTAVLQRKSGGDAEHAGGVIGSSSAARHLHSGGMVGGSNLRGDERLIVGQTGERMLSRSEWRALQSIKGLGAAMPAQSAARGGGDGGAQLVVGRMRIVNWATGEARFEGIATRAAEAVADGDREFGRHLERMGRP